MLFSRAVVGLLLAGSVLAENYGLECCVPNETHACRGYEPSPLTPEPTRSPTLSPVQPTTTSATTTAAAEGTTTTPRTRDPGTTTTESAGGDTTTGQNSVPTTGTTASTTTEAATTTTAAAETSATTRATTTQATTGPAECVEFGKYDFSLVGSATELANMYPVWKQSDDSDTKFDSNALFFKGNSENSWWRTEDLDLPDMFGGDGEVKILVDYCVQNTNSKSDFYFRYDDSATSGFVTEKFLMNYGDINGDLMEGTDCKEGASHVFEIQGEKFSVDFHGGMAGNNAVWLKKVVLEFCPLTATTTTAATTAGSTQPGETTTTAATTTGPTDAPSVCPYANSALPRQQEFDEDVATSTDATGYDFDFNDQTERDYWLGYHSGTCGDTSAVICRGFANPGTCSGTQTNDLIGCDGDKCDLNKDDLLFCEPDTGAGGPEHLLCLQVMETPEKKIENGQVQLLGVNLRVGCDANLLEASSCPADERAKIEDSHYGFYSLLMKSGRKSRYITYRHEATDTEGVTGYSTNANEEDTYYTFGQGLSHLDVCVNWCA